jgi:hypothetical protein
LLAEELWGAEEVGAKEFEAAGEPGLFVLKYSTHAGSTEEGSCRYCSYISSTSQSFAPKSCADTGKLLLHWLRGLAYRP